MLRALTRRAFLSAVSRIVADRARGACAYTVNRVEHYGLERVANRKTREHVEPGSLITCLCHHFPFLSFTRSALTHTLPSPLSGSTSTS